MSEFEKFEKELRELMKKYNVSLESYTFEDGDFLATGYRFEGSNDSLDVTHLEENT